MSSRSTALYQYAATYSLIAPISLSLVLFVLLSIPGGSKGPEAANGLIGVSFTLTLTAIVAGIFSLFGLRNGPKLGILLQAIPGILMGVAVALGLSAMGILTPER